MSLFHRKEQHLTGVKKPIYVGKIKFSRYCQALREPSIRQTLREAAATRRSSTKP